MRRGRRQRPDAEGRLTYHEAPVTGNNAQGPTHSPWSGRGSALSAVGGAKSW